MFQDLDKRVSSIESAIDDGHKFRVLVKFVRIVADHTTDKRVAGVADFLEWWIKADIWNEETENKTIGLFHALYPSLDNTALAQHIVKVFRGKQK